MQEEQKKLKQPTRIYFDAVGNVEFKREDFLPNQKGKNNPNYTYSRLTLYLNQNDQKTRIGLMGGFNPQNKIYAMSDNKESMIIDFADRDNEEIIKQVSSLSLFQIGLNKVDVPKTKFNEETNELEVVLRADGKAEMIKVWNFQNFLTEYDLINFLGQNLKNGQRVRMTGEITLNLYEGKIQKNYKLNKIYLLTEEENFEDRFLLKVETLVDKDSLNESETTTQEDNKYKIKVNTKIFHQVNKNKREVLPLEIFYIFEDETKGKKLIDKLFKVDGDTVRKVILECHLFNGKIYNQAESAEIEISDELKEFIEMGIYTEEEILKDLQPKYSNVKYVEEIIMNKPFFIKQDGKAIVSIDDTFYNKEDLINLEIIQEESKDKKEEKSSNVNDDDLDLDDFGLDDTESNVFDGIVNEEDDDDLPF